MISLELRARSKTLVRAAALAWLFVSSLAGCAQARSICASERVAVDSAELFLEIHGNNHSAPVMLWLHGGPGGAERPLFRYFNQDLERSFVVAYLDQRGTGRSFDRDADPQRLTIARHLADLDAVVDQLRAKLARDTIALVGHSWGGALALLYAHAHPEKVSAVVAVSPLVTPRASQEEEYEFVIAEACRRHDDDALAKLHEIGTPPFDDADEALAVERIADAYGAVYHRPPRKAWVVMRGVFAGLVTPWEIPRFIRGNQVSLEAMYQELLGLDLTQSVPSLDVPVVFLLGRYDRHVSAQVAAAYFANLRAPVKKLVWFENSAHNPPFEEPQRFNETLRRKLGAVVGPASSSLPPLRRLSAPPLAAVQQRVAPDRQQPASPPVAGR